MNRLPSIIACFLTLASCCCLARDAAAEHWTSPDGLISVEIPNLERFRPSSEGAMKTWVADDALAVLAVETMPWPYSREMNEAPIHRGFLREIRGTMLRANRKSVDGRTVFCMTARFKEDPAFDSFIVQHVVRIQNKVYKLMAMRRLDDPKNDQDIQAFLASLKINVGIASDPKRTTTISQPKQSTPPADTECSIESIAGRIGGAGFVVLILFAITAAFNRFRN